MFSWKNKISVLSAALAGAVTVASSANAENKWLSGLYLKGEAGASFSRDTGRITFVDQDGVTGELKNKDLGTAATFGLGVGKKFGDKLRTDLTFNYRSGN